MYTLTPNYLFSVYLPIFVLPSLYLFVKTIHLVNITYNIVFLGMWEPSKEETVVCSPPKTDTLFWQEFQLEGMVETK